MKHWISISQADISFCLANDFDISEHEALRSVQVARRSGTCKIIATWESEDNVEDLAAQVSSELGCKLEWVGERNTVPRKPRRKWWQQAQKPIVWLTALVAVLGLLESLRHYHAWLLAPAEFEVIPQSVHTINVLEGHQTELSWQLRNTASLGELRVQLEELIARDQKGKVVKTWKDDTLKQGITEGISSGSAIPYIIPVPSLESGTYTFEAKFRGSSGWARLSKLKSGKLDLRIWKRWEKTLVSINNAGNQRIAIVRLEFGETPPTGWSFKAELPAGVKAEFVNVSALPRLSVSDLWIQGSDLKQLATGDLSVSKPFETNKYQLIFYMTGPNVTDAQWDDASNYLFDNIIISEKGYL